MRAAYELGALYPLYLTRPFGFLVYNITYPKKLVLYSWEEPILCDSLNCCSSGVFVKIERSKPRVSSWVLQLVKDILHYVGLSCEGFEGELMALLTTIEASHN